jgi:DNA invertase Pin-like site-specific DNA recombinase
MAIIGYARVSLDEQNPDLQINALRAAGAERLYVDQATGATMSRPELSRALEEAQAGDVFAVWRLDRLGRSLPDLITQVNQLAERGIEFRSLTETIDTTSPGGRLVFHVFGAVAQFEREILIDRTKAGLAAARASGKKVGRPRLVTRERAGTARELRDAGMTLRGIATHMRVSQATVARLLELDAGSGLPT